QDGRHQLLQDPREIAVMFDKRECHARLAGAGVRVPRSVGPVHSYDQLLSRMRDARLRRVFIKPAHGSSASGVVAYQMDESHELATTTVEMVHDGGELLLYNSRLIRNYRDRREIAELIDALCAQGVHVEQWLPKA